MTVPSDRILDAVRLLKENGFDDVIPILMRGQSRTKADTKSTRKRGVHVRLGSERGPKAFLDEERIREMAEHQ